jgi:plasmid maintenance system antidote protein VapI
MNKKHCYLENVLEEALQESGLSISQLGDLSGVSPAIIWRFIQGERTMTLPTASKLIEALEMEIAIKPKRKKKRQVMK